MPAAGEAVTRQFTTRNPATKARSNADALPTAVLVRNGEDTAVACTVSNVAIGVYKVTVTLPSTYVVGDEVEFRVTATVDEVTDSCILQIGEIESRSATTTATTSTDWLTNLTTSRDNLAIRLAEISANPKPTYSVNGQSFSHVEFQRYLLDAIKEIDDLLVSRESPYEIHSASL
jgi:hypothetical protein